MFLKNYYTKIIKQELINKFNHKTIKNLPKLKKITLNFGCKKSEVKSVAACLLALELISSKRSKITVSKKPNILLKIRKGDPVGCKITLKKEKMYNFLSRLLIEILPKFKNFVDLKFFIKKNNFSYKLENPLILLELEKNYYLFNKLPHLNITFATTSKNKSELTFLLNAFKFNVIEKQ